MAIETMKQFYNQTKEEFIQYKKDDKVWFETINITTRYPMKKLNNKHLGSFEILERVRKLAYCLKLTS